MHIGIFIHSQSGHTSAIGMAITKKLRESGHEVDIELMKPAGKIRPRKKDIEFREDIPDMTPYDVVIFGGPIWAFTASPVVRAFIKEIPRLKDKKALCFSTSGFPTAISGAKGGLKDLNHLLEERDAIVLEGEAVFWGLWCGKSKMEAIAERVCARIERK